MSGSPVRLNRLKGLPCNFEGYRFFNPDSIFLRILSVFNSRYDTVWRLFCQIISSIYFLPIKSVCLKTPELLFIETKWSCLIPFEKTANLLKDLLPVSETLNSTTIQNNLYDLVMTQEKEIGEEQFMFDCGSINERRALPKPERTMVVGIDGDYIRDWNEKKVMGIFSLLK